MKYLDKALPAALLLLVTAACSPSDAGADALPPPSRDGWVAGGAFPGFTLIGPLRSRRAYLVDMSGTAVHSWVTSATPNAMYLTNRGTLFRCLDGKDHPIFRGGVLVQVCRERSVVPAGGSPAPAKVVPAG